MRNIIWLIAIFLLLIIQTGILNTFGISPVNLILIVVAVASILSDFKQGLIVTLIGGVLMDFASSMPDGMIGLTLVLLFLILHLILNELLSREPNHLIIAATIAGSTIIYYLVFLAINSLFTVINLSSTLDTSYFLTRQLPLALIWNLFFSYPIFKYYTFVQKLASRIKKDEEPIRA